MIACSRTLDEDIYFMKFAQCIPIENPAHKNLHEYHQKGFGHKSKDSHCRGPIVCRTSCSNADSQSLSCTLAYNSLRCCMYGSNDTPFVAAGLHHRQGILGSAAPRLHIDLCRHIKGVCWKGHACFTVHQRGCESSTPPVQVVTAHTHNASH
jgi:hypothetical protein